MPIRPVPSVAWRRACRTLLAIPFLILAGCATGAAGTSARMQVPVMLQRQAEAWNAGDIDAFMEPYWRSPDLTFTSGGRITRGWAQTRAGYRERYPTKSDMGRLIFGDLEITQLGPSAALVLGAWHLNRAEPVGGLFTLVLRKEGGRWIIIHDHTSRHSD